MITKSYLFIWYFLHFKCFYHFKEHKLWIFRSSTINIKRSSAHFHSIIPFIPAKRSKLILPTHIIDRLLNHLCRSFNLWLLFHMCRLIRGACKLRWWHPFSSIYTLMMMNSSWLLNIISISWPFIRLLISWINCTRIVIRCIQSIIQILLSIIGTLIASHIWNFCNFLCVT
jgi:hypothetical protein